MFNYCEWWNYCYSARTADEVRVYDMSRHRLKIALRGCMPGGVFLNSNIRNIINSYPTTHTGNPLGTRRCCDIESTSHWAHGVVATSNQRPTGHTTLLWRESTSHWAHDVVATLNKRPTGHTTLLRHRINSLLATRRCCDVESTPYWAHDVVATLIPTRHTTLLWRWISVPLGTRRCCDVESTSHWTHGVVATLNQRPTGHTTLLRHWINVPLGTRRCCDVESTYRWPHDVVATLNQRPTGHTTLLRRWINVESTSIDVRWFNVATTSCAQWEPTNGHFLTVGPASQTVDQQSVNIPAPTPANTHIDQMLSLCWPSVYPTLAQHWANVSFCWDEALNQWWFNVA